MKTISVITALFLLTISNANAKNVAFEKAQPVNKVEISTLIHNEVKASMAALEASFEIKATKALTPIKTAKQGKKAELLVKTTVLSE
ncbi:hypothetical protein [Thalassotalea sediminis]|uniref:hypothetical protein n=1 Tax=Thalassotalea sediminis TaxID=1759089 RepID=UPI0025744462|nr:hypothetical protein [Thalassotalea sediminis]